MKTQHFLQFAAGLAIATSSLVIQAQTFTPSQQPSDTAAVPGNVMLALSVEWPTGLQATYTTTDYTVMTEYVGYFDNRKCYSYSSSNEVFTPTTAMNANGSCSNGSHWSGNLLNWLTMSNLDQFRSVMTGGARDTFSSVSSASSGDSTTSTILIRSFADRLSSTGVGGITPTKNLVAGTPGMPLGSNRFVRAANFGSKMIASTDNTFPTPANNTVRQQSCDDYDGALANNDTCFNIRVRACFPSPALDRSTGLPFPVDVIEPNCNATYSGVAKPEGLIQQYAGSLRFGAVGYLNNTGTQWNGGVLRSAMKSVGPTAATATGIVPNSNPEWNSVTGVMSANPDPADAAADGVGNSGLMNYLNKFGYFTGYKGNDPVSELYYAAQLYMRGHAPPADYKPAMAANATPLDGFPAITGAAHRRGGSRDPMLNSCQKNFVVAIGDIFTHCDGNLPGSIRTGCSNEIPADPDGLNVQNLWNATRTQEGLADLRDTTGVIGWAGGASGGNPNYATPYVAALAHWANTNDIRSDLPGNQTIATYFVDVLENGNYNLGMPAAGLLRTQYWLAAKYGGFKNTTAYPDDVDSVAGNNPNVNASSWDKNGDGVPDTWFAGSSPTLLRNGLTTAFENISRDSDAGSASSAAVTSSRQTSNSQIIYAGYNPKGWSGTLTACTPSQTAAQCASNPAWEASNWLNAATTATYVTTPLTATTRKIITATPPGTTPFATMPFQWASLNANQRSILSASGLGTATLAFLRGDRSGEGTTFRRRNASVLGDIVNSGVTYVAGSGPAYSGPNFAGHAAYRASNRNRPPVVYVGGNDGMLHAFSGTDGKELFAYVPGLAFPYLPSLSSVSFRHRYFVDGTPMVADYESTPGTWGSLLVGGMGAGARGYYALDITAQSTFGSASEAALTAAPRWEFSSAQDGDLGFTFNEPSIDPQTGAYRQIAKVADDASANASGVWRVIVGNGYGSNNGRAILYFLNASTGLLANKLTATAGPANGLSAPTPVDTDRDGLIDTVYAGDLQGNMHKFQFSILSGANYVLASPGQNTGAAWRYLGVLFASGEPITTAPAVTSGPDGVGQYVSFGSGKFNEDTDFANTARRGFYAVIDRAPSSSLTVLTTQLATITYTTTVDPTTGVSTRNWSQPNLSGLLGWKMFFTGGERVLTNATLPPDTGAVLFATTQPNGNICDPSNSGFLMAVSLASGAGGQLVVGGLSVGGVAVQSSGVVKVSNTYTNRSNQQTVVCNQDGCKGTNAPILNQSIAPRGRYNWREILTK